MSSDDESLGEVDNEELLRQYAEEDSGSDDSSDMEPDDPSVTAFRASIAQFDAIITHAVEQGFDPDWLQKNKKKGEDRLRVCFIIPAIVK